MHKLTKLRTGKYKYRDFSISNIKGHGWIVRDDLKWLVISGRESLIGDPSESLEAAKRKIDDVISGVWYKNK